MAEKGHILLKLAVRQLVLLHTLEEPTCLPSGVLPGTLIVMMCSAFLYAVGISAKYVSNSITCFADIILGNTLPRDETQVIKNSFKWVKGLPADGS
jgi:hypothetical protein